MDIHIHIIHITIWNHIVPNNTMISLSMISLEFSLYQLEYFVSLSGHCHAIYGIVCHPFLSSHRKMSNVIWNAGISNSPIFDAGESMLSYAGIPSKIVTQPYLSYFICCLSWRCETLNGRNWKKKKWMENLWRNIRSSSLEYFVKYRLLIAFGVMCNICLFCCMSTIHELRFCPTFNLPASIFSAACKFGKQMGREWAI